MAVLPLEFSTADIARGPVYIWTDTVLPATAAAEVVITVTNGIPTPDSVTNLSAVHWGLSTGGAELLYRPSTQMAEADELTAPYRTSLIGEEVVISAKGLLQLGQDFDLAAKAMVGGTVSTPTGKRKIIMGGLSTVTYRTVMAIWAQPEAPTKYVYWLLYNAYNDAGLALQLSRKSDASTDVAFRGHAISTRTNGDQIGQIVMST